MEMKEYLYGKLSGSAGLDVLLQEIHPDMETRWFLKAGVQEAESESPENWDCALTRLRLILYAWKHDIECNVRMGEGSSAHESLSILQTMRTCFFSQGWVFRLVYALKSKNRIDEETEKLAAEMAVDILKFGERGPNNRSFFYGMAHGYGVKCFPYLKECKKWQEYAEAVFYDWYDGGGCYEPGYVAHNIAWVIELGRLLGKEEELRSEKACRMYRRYLDHVSPSGLVVAPGDGDDQSSYLKAFLCMEEVTGDPAYRWAAKKVEAAGEYGGYRGKNEKRRVSERLEGYDNLAPEGGCLKVQNLYPDNPETRDRILLNPSRKTGNPYFGMMVNDHYDTLHHESEDNRGEIYHYEVDGVLYLARSSWYKWAEQTNTVIIKDALEEYPFVYSEGMLQNHWYRASGDLRLMEHFMPDERYEQCLNTFDRFRHFERAGKDQREYDMPLPLQYMDRESPLGVFLSNPGGMAGNNKEISISSVTLSIHTFPESYWDEEVKPFRSAMSWNRDEHRHVVYSDGAAALEIKNLHLAGPAGKYYFHQAYDLFQCLRVIWYPAEGEPRLLNAEEVKEFVTLSSENEKPVFCIHAGYGRLDLMFAGISEIVRTTDEYTRIGFDYCYKSDVRNYLRTPIKILVNRTTTRSLHADHQQGGVLTKTKAEQQGEDCYGEARYRGVYTYDTDWTRKTLLTKEGVLIVVDEIDPGEDAEGMAGGPVWQLKEAPVMGLSWADSVVEKELKKSLLVYCHPSRGHRYGTQCQPKLWVDREYAFYDRVILKPGRKEIFITVLIPHDQSVSPLAVCNKKNEGGRLEPSKEQRKDGIIQADELQDGILTGHDEAGNVTVRIHQAAGLQNMNIQIGADGSFSVDRE